MGKDSGVTWAHHSWGCWRGCRKVRPEAECKNCYAARDMKRYGKDFGTVVRAARPTFNGPLKWPAGRVFVCPWSDFWIEDADDWRDDAYAVMRQRPDHTYIIPTKRPENIEERLPDDWGEGWPNVWGLVSAGTQEAADLFVPEILSLPFWVRGVSAEPLLEYMDLAQYYGGYNVTNEQRGYSLSGRGKWRVRNRQDGASLAIEVEEGKSLDGRHESLPTYPPESGEQNGGQGLFSSSSNVGQQKISRYGSQARLEAFSRPHPGRDNYQSQEWRQTGQQTGESRTGNLLRADTTRSEDTRDSQCCESMGRKQSCCEINNSASERYFEQKKEGGVFKPNSPSTWRHVSVHIEDLSRRESAPWLIIGCESAPGKRVGRLGVFQSEQDWIDGAVTMVEQARQSGVKVFVKQVPINGRVNDNPADWIPELRYQEFPE